jgi:hypothetical protein
MFPVAKELLVEMGVSWVEMAGVSHGHEQVIAQAFER